MKILDLHLGHELQIFTAVCLLDLLMVISVCRRFIILMLSITYKSDFQIMVVGFPHPKIIKEFSLPYLNSFFFLQ